MTVYVDDCRIPYLGMLMCHMMADSTGELVAMARQIGVNPKFIQHAGTPLEHFDVCRSKRAMAVRAGAIEVTSRQMAKMRMARKKSEVTE